MKDWKKKFKDLVIGSSQDGAHVEIDESKLEELIQQVEADAFKRGAKGPVTEVITNVFRQRHDNEIMDQAYERAAQVALNDKVKTDKMLGAQERGWNDACDEIAHAIRELKDE